MALVLFTWNPESYFVADRQWAREIKQIEDCGFLYSQWSCGNSIYIKPGDHAFLLRQGKDRRGIVASGVVTSEVFEELHWDQENHEGETTKYCDITWTTQLPIDKRLTIEKLQEQLPKVHWSPFSSGTRIPEEAHTKFLKLWDKTISASGINLNQFRPQVQQIAHTPEVGQEFCSNCHVDSRAMYGRNPHVILVNYAGPADATPTALCRNCLAIAQSQNPALNISELESTTAIHF